MTGLANGTPYTFRISAGVVQRVDRFGQIWITQHSPAQSMVPLSIWKQTDDSGRYTPGHWNQHLILYIVRPRAW